MRTILCIDAGYDEITADLTGQELETLLKIMGKMQQVDERHLHRVR